MKPLCGCFALAVVLLLIDCPCFALDDPRPLLQAMVTSVRQIRDMRYSMVCERDGKPFAELERASDQGKEFYGGSIFLKIPGKEELVRQSVKWAFDGEKLRALRTNERPAVSTGAIRPFDPIDFRMYPSAHTLMGFGPNSATRSIGELLAECRDVRVLDGTEMVDGRACRVVEAIGADRIGDKLFDVRVWVDQERDARVLRLETFYHYPQPHAWKALFQRVDHVQLQQVDGVWFPVAGELHQFSHTFAPRPGVDRQAMEQASPDRRAEVVDIQLKDLGQYRIRIDPTSVKVNRGIPAEAFTFRFPDKCLLTDSFIGKSYTVGEAELDESVGRSHPTPASSPSGIPSADRASSGSTNTSTIIAWVVGMAVLVGGVWVYARRGRGVRTPPGQGAS